MADLHYLTYDPEAMWREIHLAYLGQGGDPLYPGDEKEMLLRGAMAILAQCYAAADHAARMQTLRYATGEYLDLIGEKRGIERIAAVAATGKINITIKPGAAGHVLAAGTLYTDGARTYQLSEGIAVPAGTENVTVSADSTCTEAGSVGNALMAGTLLYPIQQDAKAISVIVTETTRGGLEEEADEAYRERIRTGGFYGATTGPAGAYESRAEAVSASIVDAKARRAEAGEVEVSLLLEEGLTEEEETQIQSDVLEALNGESARPIADTVTVRKAEEVPYELNILYEAEGASTENMAILLAQAADAYKAWQEGAVGRPFDPYRLLAALYTAGATRAEWDEASNLNSGEVARTAMEAYQCLKGTITLTEMEGS